MLYRYNKNLLIYTKVKFGEVLFKGSILLIVLIAVLGLKSAVDRARVDNLTYEEKLIILGDFNQFTEEKLIQRIENLNFRFPHIVLAQAKLETGNFSSKSFTYANNLFGMKQARARSTTANGTAMGHAQYDNWMESLYDYALFTNAYLNKIRLESQYYDYLSQNYAEDPKYVSKLKNIVKKENLKSKF